MAAAVIFQNPVQIELRWSDSAQPVDQIDDGWGVVDVYLVDEIGYQNNTGNPWLFAAEDAYGHSYEFTIPAAESGIKRPPTAKKFTTHNATYHLSRR